MVSTKGQLTFEEREFAKEQSVDERVAGDRWKGDSCVKEGVGFGFCHRRSV